MDVQDLISRSHSSAALPSGSFDAPPLRRLRKRDELTPIERKFADEENAVAYSMFDDRKRLDTLVDELNDKNKMGAHIIALDGLAAMVRKYVPALLERVSNLEKRLAEVETRGLRYRGVWQRADDYKRGDVTTCDGGLWVALSDNPKNKPGEGAMWQLAVPPARR
jgi:hypothetical protein